LDQGIDLEAMKMHLDFSNLTTVYLPATTKLKTCIPTEVSIHHNTFDLQYPSATSRHPYAMLLQLVLMLLLSSSPLIKQPFLLLLFFS
jgi:hypothetical protein